MSYEPRLIIRRSDLIKHENTFEYEQYNLDKDNAEVSKYLLEIVKGGYIKFKEIELYICQPEFSKFNQMSNIKSTTNFKLKNNKNENSRTVFSKRIQ